MANYIESSKIIVYPSAYRSNDGGWSKLNSEQNITWLNRLSSKNENNTNFYIDPLNTNYYILSLSGYKFKFEKGKIPKKDTGKYFKYVMICVLSETDNNSTGRVLASISEGEAGIEGSITNLDPTSNTESSGGYFKGLYFSDTEPETNDFVYYELSSDGENLNLQDLKLSSTEVRDGDTNCSLKEQIQTDRVRINQALLLTYADSDADNDTYFTKELTYISTKTQINNDLYVNNLFISSEKAQESTQTALLINSEGKVLKNDLTTSEPAVNGATNEFISNLSQDSKGKITISKKSLNIANSTTLGGVKSSITGNVTSEDSTRDYKVEVNTDGTMKVNVPWINTTYSNATQSTNGLMSAADKKKLDEIAQKAEVNVQSDWSQSITTADDYIKNKPTTIEWKFTLKDGTAVTYNVYASKKA